MTTNQLDLTATGSKSSILGAQFLARYLGDTRLFYGTRLNIFFEWCATNNLDPITDLTRDLLGLKVKD